MPYLSLLRETHYYVVDFTHVDACDNSSFIFTAVECSIVHTTVSSSILLLIDIWVISTLELTKTVLLGKIKCENHCSRIYTAGWVVGYMNVQFY